MSNLPGRIHSFARKACLAILPLSILAFSQLSARQMNSTGDSSANRSVLAQNQLQRSPTSRPTLTPTPTRPAPNLKRQVVFGLGGGGLACSSIVAPDMDLPAVAYERFSEGGGWDIVCLYGFEPGETVQVRIFDPRGRQVYSVKKFIREGDFFGYGFPVNNFFLSPLPNNAPAGEWRITAEGAGGRAENFYHHPDNYNRLTVNKAVPTGAPWFDPRRLPVFIPGQTLRLQGVMLPANQDLAVGLYRASGDLISGQTVRTNRSGAFEAGFAITRDFSPDSYFAVIVFDQNQETYSLDDNLIHFEVRQAAQPCPGAMASQLKKDGYALVSAGPSNNVREKPGSNSRLLGQVLEYEQLEILAGPKCADGMVWWKVYSMNTGLDGWTAEGKNGDYWLNPYGY